MTTVKEYIKKYGKIRIEDQNGFLFWSNGENKIGGRIIKRNGKVRTL